MIPVKHLRKGSYMIYKEEPCIVKEVVNVVTGTHSHTKVKVSFHGLFSGVNDSVTLPPHDSVEETEIIRKEGQLISKSDSKVQIMDMRTYETIDADSGELELNEGDSVTFIDFNGKAKVLEKR
jgi:translation elongation factor P/translation initiation factor 5A